VASLVHGDRLLALQDHDARGGAPELQLPRNRKPQNSRPDHGYIALDASHPYILKDRLATDQLRDLL
jgi:hypothetical protein